MKVWLGMLMIGVMLTGCVSRPVVIGSEQPSSDNWSLKGKLAISTASERGSFSIDWRQQGPHFDIGLFGPLGVGVARIHGDDVRATLEVAGESDVIANGADDLLLRLSGTDLPVYSMTYWLRGRSAPGPFEKKVKGIRQQGWDIEYLAYVGELPAKIRMTRPEASITVVVKQWND